MEALRRLALGAPWILTVGTGRWNGRQVAVIATTFVGVPVADPNGVGTPMTRRGSCARDSAPASAV